MITELSQVNLAIYDTNAQPFVYTGSENIDITDNQISLHFPIKMNNEIVLNPRAYEGAVFEMIPGTGDFSFRQDTIHGGQPIVQLYSSTKACTFHGDCDIPKMCKKTPVGILTADIYTDIYFKNRNLYMKFKYRFKQLLDESRSWYIIFKYRFKQLLY